MSDPAGSVVYPFAMGLPALLLVALAVQVDASAAATPPESEAELVAASLRQARECTSPSPLVASPQWRAQARSRPEERVVDLTWSRERPKGGVDLAVLRFDVAFEPTAVECASPDRLVVAGRIPSRDTAAPPVIVVEVWTVEPPSDDQVRGVGPKAAEPVFRERVLTADTSELGHVLHVVNNHGSRDSAFLQFAQVDHVYELAWEGEWRGVVRKVIDAGEEPALDRDGQRLWFGILGEWHFSNHISEGFLYTLDDGMTCGSRQTFVYLFDRDRDGRIDEVAKPSDVDWMGRGLGRAANYLDLPTLAPPPREDAR